MALDSGCSPLLNYCASLAREHRRKLGASRLVASSILNFAVTAGTSCLRMAGCFVPRRDGVLMFYS